MMKKDVNISILGHVDHGKSSLVAAMSNSFSKVGIAPFVPYEQIDLAVIGNDESLNLSRAQIKIEGQSSNYIVTDYPSHQDFIKSLISSKNIDGILLVVSAADGPMSQTREHLRLARNLGVEKISVFINKIDMVSQSLQEMVVKEVKQLLMDVGFDCGECPIIYGSALQARKCGCGKRECQNCGFLFQILDSFENYFVSNVSDKDRGLFFVVTESSDTPFGMMLAKGMLISGDFKKEEKVSLLTDSGVKTAIVKGLENNGESEEKSSQENIAVYLEGVSAQEVGKGSPIFKDGKKNIKNFFNSLIYIFRKEEDGRESALPKESNLLVSIFGRELEAKIKLPQDRESVLPGDSSFATFLLKKEYFLKKGFSFYLVENGKKIGIGKIVELGE